MQRMNIFSSIGEKTHGKYDGFKGFCWRKDKGIFVICGYFLAFATRSTFRQLWNHEGSSSILEGQTHSKKTLKWQCWMGNCR